MPPRRSRTALTTCLRPLGRAEVGGHEQLRLRQVLGGRSRGGDHCGSRTSEALDDGFADASGAAGHERALAGEFGFGGDARSMYLHWNSL